MVLNSKYEMYNGRNKEPEADKSEDANYASFGITGKPHFRSLDDLKKEGFKRFIPRLPEHRTDPKETIVYATDSVTIVISANYETDYHEVDIIAKEVLEDLNIIENTKSLLEKTLGFALIDPTKPISKLIKEVGEN